MEQEMYHKVQVEFLPNVFIQHAHYVYLYIHVLLGYILPHVNDPRVLKHRQLCRRMNKAIVIYANAFCFFLTLGVRKEEYQDVEEGVVVTPTHDNEFHTDSGKG